MGPSYEEKSVWVQLLTVGGALAVYAVVAGRMLSAGVQTLVPYAGLFLAIVGLLVVAQIVGHIAAAIVGSREDADERDRRFAERATHRSAWVLTTGVLAALTVLTLGGAPVWAAHVLVVALFGSELLSIGLRLVYYRAGGAR